MSNINDLYPSKYLKASDLQGRSIRLTIESMKVEELGQGDKKQRKPVLYFVGKQKGLALNKSNAMIISSYYSPDTEGWIGKDIEIRPDKTMFGDRLVDCISVSVPVPKAEDSAEEPPF